MMEALYYIVLGSILTVILGTLKSRYFGFAGQSPKDYADAPGEAFDLRTHLKGPIACEGVIYGPTGRVASRFTADFDAKWDGNFGVMSERFVYDDGSIQDREWRLTLGNDGQIKADADDLVGSGTGQSAGPAMQLNYKIRLPKESGGHVLDTVDWMYLTPSGTIVNRSQFRKFGIKVAELVATMHRKEAA